MNLSELKVRLYDDYLPRSATMTAEEFAEVVAQIESEGLLTTLISARANGGVGLAIGRAFDYPEIQPELLCVIADQHLPEAAGLRYSIEIAKVGWRTFTPITMSERNTKLRKWLGLPELGKLRLIDFEY